MLGGQDFTLNPKARAKEVEAAIKNLPLAQKIKALAIYRYYQEINKIEEIKIKEAKEVEKKYLKLEDPIIKAQSAIINGERAATIDELKNKEKYLKEEEQKEIETNLTARKIPEYWLKVMKNCDVVKSDITQADEQALKHLENIHIIDEDGTDNFEVVFTFSENPFFKNKELKKKFIIVDDYPKKTEGTVIEWEQGKDLTKKEIKKKQKNKKTGQSRVVTKVVEAESFFNIFGTIEVTDQDDMEVDEEEMKKRERMEQDFEICGNIVDECVPYSLEYYLGVKSHDHDDGEFEDDDEDDEDGDKDEDEQEPKKKSKSKGKGEKADKADKADNKKGPAGENPQCKQQ